jgi:hypothetical protein
VSDQKVVALYGDPIPGQPEERVCDVLARYLDMARAGELTAISIIGLAANGEAYSVVSASASQKLAMLGAVEMAKQDLIAAIDDSSGRLPPSAS